LSRRRAKHDRCHTRLRGCIIGRMTPERRLKSLQRLHAALVALSVAVPAILVLASAPLEPKWLPWPSPEVATFRRQMAACACMAAEAPAQNRQTYAQAECHRQVDVLVLVSRVRALCDAPECESGECRAALERFWSPRLVLSATSPPKICEPPSVSRVELDALLSANNSQTICDGAAEIAKELPEIRFGWSWLRESYWLPLILAILCFLGGLLLLFVAMILADWLKDRPNFVGRRGVLAISVTVSLTTVAVMVYALLSVTMFCGAIMTTALRSPRIGQGFLMFLVFSFLFGAARRLSSATSRTLAWWKLALGVGPLAVAPFILQRVSDEPLALLLAVTVTIGVSLIRTVEAVAELRRR
jgi:hypothetical protein